MKRAWLVLFFLAAPLCASADPGDFSISFGGVAAKSYAPVPLRPNGGFGVTGTLEYRFSDLFSGGLGGGLVEYISPSGDEDMKTAWLDVIGRFFPWAASSLGQPYWQVGFGVSPFIAGVYSDYWPDYAADRLGQPLAPGAIYWNAQTSLGYRFSLSPTWALDTGIQYNLFWPPANRLLQTLGVEARLVLLLGK